MNSVLLELNEMLLETCMIQQEIDYLLARFLEQETFRYLMFILNTLDEYKIVYVSDFIS